MSLGGNGGLFNRVPERPKWMRKSRYEAQTEVVSKGQETFVLEMARRWHFLDNS